MFIEQGFQNQHSGWIEVICGSMFSGKTEELIRRLNRSKIANMQVAIFKPAIDTRYHEHQLVSHDAKKTNAIPVESALEILSKIETADVIGIDEAQFFDDQLIEVAAQLAKMGKRVIVAGLDMDYLGRPYGPMPGLLATANFITKLHAVCMKCGGLAGYSYRITNQDEQLVLGEKQHYEARCRNCFQL